MAKTARKNRARNARRKNRELRRVMKGAVPEIKSRNGVALGMILSGQGCFRHSDSRKEESRTACRGKWKDEREA